MDPMVEESDHRALGVHVVEKPLLLVTVSIANTDGNKNTSESRYGFIRVPKDTVS